MTAPTSRHRATTWVLVAVALIGGAILLLGDRFEAAQGRTLSQPVTVEAHIAACVGDESMRLINPERDRCKANERELASDRAGSLSGAAAVGSPAPTATVQSISVAALTVMIAALTVAAR